MVEWEMLLPLVQRDKNSPPHKVSKVLFPVRRLSWFYMQNIVLMMFILTSLGLLAFTMDVSDLGSRVSTVLTIILTAVAFKFIISDNLPKVQYNTAIDYYVLACTISLALMAALSVVPGLSFIRDGPGWNTCLGSTFAVVVVVELVHWLAWAKHVAQQGMKTGQIGRV